ASEEFLFQPCTQKLSLLMVKTPPFQAPLGRYAFELLSQSGEPIAEASFYAVSSKGERLGPFPMTLSERSGRREVYTGSYIGPAECGAERVTLVGLVKTASGKVIDGRRPTESCVEMLLGLPAPSCGSGFELEMKQEYRSCAESSPDRIFLDAKGSSTELDSDLDLTAGPPGPSTPAGHADNPEYYFHHHLAVDVTGRPEGELTIRGTVSKPDVSSSLTKELIAFVDRTPPAAEIFQPSEGAAV